MRASFPSPRPRFSTDTNEVGDVGLSAFCTHVRAPPSRLPRIYELWLSNNHIGDAGAAALFDALGDGAMATLGDLRMQFNRLGDPAMDRLVTALSRGALSQTWYLGLSDNLFTDQGVLALSAQIQAGGLPKIEFITASSPRSNRSAQEQLQHTASAAMANRARARRPPATETHG